MKSAITLFSFFLLYTHQVWGIFSQHVRVTPENYGKHKLKVQFITENDESVRVTVEGKILAGLSNFLITMPNRISEDRQNFRYLIWKNGDENALQAQSIKTLKANPTQADAKVFSVVFHIKQEELNQAYLYLDYPTPILDGGFYYTVDLPLFATDVQVTGKKQDK